MSKAKKVLDEAREIQNPELDLADKGVATFEEMPGLRESHRRVLTRASLPDRQIRQLVARGWSLARDQHHGHLRGSRGRVRRMRARVRFLNLTIRV